MVITTRSDNALTYAEFFLKKLIFWNYFTQNSEIYNLTIRTANQNSNSVLIIIFIEDFLSTVLWVFRFRFKPDNFLCLMVILKYFSSQLAFRSFSIILTLKRRLWSCISFCGTEWVLLSRISYQNFVSWLMLYWFSSCFIFFHHFHF